jgi:hypothetical protein
LAGRERIKHIVVLMMENRSFDHLVGFLDHDNPDYPRLDRLDVSCPRYPWLPFGPRVRPTPDALAVLGTDPDHSHEAVLDQLYTRSGKPTMTGFIDSFAYKIKHGTRRRMSWWQRAFARLTSLLTGLFRRRPLIPAKAGEIMRCFPPGEIPVLGRLAKEYGSLIAWHSSVPGETWPNRQFAHAATAHGTADIEIGFYEDPTVFERLSAAGRTWSIYVDGVAQVMAYPKLWVGGTGHFHGMDRLRSDIRDGTLPDYAFIEPDHGIGPGEGNSQHPGNNLVSGDSFAAGEALIASVYNELVANPALFASTLLLITYDEHGGFYDHVPPPAVTPPDKYQNTFKFDIAGVRVPAVAISPLIPAGFVDKTFYEHSAIPHTVLRQFAPGAGPLTERDANSADLLDQLPLLPTPRTDVRPIPMPAPRVSAEAIGPRKMNDFQSSLVELAGGVHNARSLSSASPFSPSSPSSPASPSSAPSPSSLHPPSSLRPPSSPVPPPSAEAEHSAAAEPTPSADTSPEIPKFRPEASTLAAAQAGVLMPGSAAGQVVDAVVADFVE